MHQQLSEENVYCACSCCQHSDLVDIQGVSSVSCTHLDGEVALREVALLLGLLLSDKVLLVLGHSPADGASLLGAEVERQVLLALVEDAELGALVGVDDGEDAGDRLADVVAVSHTRQYAIPVYAPSHSLRSQISPSSILHFRFPPLFMFGFGVVGRTSCSA